MASSKRGVDWFLKGIIHMEINFPEGDVRCQWCPMCRAETDLKRFWCRTKNQMIYDPFQAGIPDWCPICFTGEITGQKEEK